MVERLSVPSVTTEQMREVDRLMIGEYGIVLLRYRLAGDLVPDPGQVPIS